MKFRINYVLVRLPLLVSTLVRIWWLDRIKHSSSPYDQWRHITLLFAFCCGEISDVLSTIDSAWQWAWHNAQHMTLNSKIYRSNIDVKSIFIIAQLCKPSHASNTHSEYVNIDMKRMILLWIMGNTGITWLPFDDLLCACIIENGGAAPVDHPTSTAIIKSTSIEMSSIHAAFIFF